MRLTNECMIRLLTSKSIAYKRGYVRATEEGDTTASRKWKKGYQEIIEKIYKLRKA